MVSLVLETATKMQSEIRMASQIIIFRFISLFPIILFEHAIKSMRILLFEENSHTPSGELLGRAVAFSYYYLSVFCVRVFIYVAKTWEINLKKCMRN